MGGQNVTWEKSETVAGDNFTESIRKSQVTN